MIEPAARGAWRELEAKLRPFVARRVRSDVDVDDVVQDVFLRMQRGLEGLRDEQRFGPWVYQVARSAVVDHQRVAAKHRVADGHADREAEDPRDVDDRALEEELAGYLAPFVAMLASPSAGSARGPDTEAGRRVLGRVSLACAGACCCAGGLHRPGRAGARALVRAATRPVRLPHMSCSALAAASALRGT
ncbi:MAG: hypothetical protein IPQ09_19930 [Myxococcales bacterium]|nr:hypothetical protein [Myxococcales bacterium]